ncbi:MAG: ATP-binding protein [Verrucomicrobiota bacterium]
MKPSRIFSLWATLGLCAVMVLGAMTWLTKGVLAAEKDRQRAERERTAAEIRADLEERTRLALWRMDALGAAIMLRENRLPDQYYQQMPPAVVSVEDPAVLLHFEIRKGGEPQSPEFSATGETGAMGGRIQRLRALLAENPLPGDEWARINRNVEQGETAWQAVPKEAVLEQGFNATQRKGQSGDQLRKDDVYQMNSNVTERAQRAKAVANQVDNDALAYAKPQAAPAAFSASRSAVGGALAKKRDELMPEGKVSREEARDSGALADIKTEEVAPATAIGRVMPAVVETTDIGQMRGIWLGGELFLLRKVVRKNPAIMGLTNLEGIQTVVQGVWLDSRVLRDTLLNEVKDLLPKAGLTPVEGERAAADPLAMVSFPFRLDRNESAAVANLHIKTPFGAPLWVAWGAVALAFLTSALLVRGVMRLSERRASFVSAVTHELRTPLTTFRLYSDMLESGAVKEEKRGGYLRVLSREADRLSHLVENVLAFSRIERGNARSNVRSVNAGDLLEPMRERFEARLATAGMTLEMDANCSRGLRVDTAAVEHILFNLIDNAAKYAASGDPPCVKISVREADRGVEIVICDHGPGIPPAERGRIFQAFHKSAREAAESQPGVGLGLALSRRLAKAQGGDLQCVDAQVGACFVLRLPADRAL